MFINISAYLLLRRSYKCDICSLPCNYVPFIFSYYVQSFLFYSESFTPHTGTGKTFLIVLAIVLILLKNHFIFFLSFPIRYSYYVPVAENMQGCV